MQQHVETTEHASPETIPDEGMTKQTLMRRLITFLVSLRGRASTDWDSMMLAMSAKSAYYGELLAEVALNTHRAKKIMRHRVGRHDVDHRPTRAEMRRMILQQAREFEKLVEAHERNANYWRSIYANVSTHRLTRWLWSSHDNVVARTYLLLICALVLGVLLGSLSAGIDWGWIATVPLAAGLLRDDPPGGPDLTENLTQPWQLRSGIPPTTRIPMCCLAEYEHFTWGHANRVLESEAKRRGASPTHHYQDDEETISYRVDWDEVGGVPLVEGTVFPDEGKPGRFNESVGALTTCNCCGKHLGHGAHLFLGTTAEGSPSDIDKLDRVEAILMDCFKLGMRESDSNRYSDPWEMPHRYFAHSLSTWYHQCELLGAPYLEFPEGQRHPATYTPLVIPSISVLCRDCYSVLVRGMEQLLLTHQRDQTLAAQAADSADMVEHTLRAELQLRKALRGSRYEFILQAAFNELALDLLRTYGRRTDDFKSGILHEVPRFEYNWFKRFRQYFPTWDVPPLGDFLCIDNDNIYRHGLLPAPVDWYRFLGRESSS